MATQAKYLTGDKKAIEEFIGKFDVSQSTDSVITSQCFRPASGGVVGAFHSWSF